MRIHVLSDLHLEMRPYLPTPVEADVVVLAGDIANGADVIDALDAATDAINDDIARNNNYAVAP